MRPAIKALSIILSLIAVSPNAWAEDDPDMAKATALFVAAFRGRCADHAFDGREKTPERYDITYRDTMAQPSEPDKKMVLFEFFCDNFPHSGSAVFIKKNDNGEISIVSFPMPVSTMVRDPANEGRLMITGLSGLMAQDTLLNADFDIETLSMTTSDHVGNDEYNTTWMLVDGLFMFSGSETWMIKDGKLQRTPSTTEE